MKKPKSLDEIELLYGTEAHVIDVLPMAMADRKYSQVEKVLSSRKLKDYADKISTIMVLLWGYYDLEIYLTKFPAKASRYKYSELAYKDIADIGFKKLYGIIEYVIMENVSSVQVYAPLNHFVISIRGGFSTRVFNAAGRDLEFIQSLVEHEGLYMYPQSDGAVSLSAQASGAGQAAEPAGGSGAAGASAVPEETVPDASPDAGYEPSAGPLPAADAGDEPPAGPLPAPDAGKEPSGEQLPAPDAGKEPSGEQLPAPDAGKEPSGEQLPAAEKHGKSGRRGKSRRPKNSGRRKK